MAKPKYTHCLSSPRADLPVLTYQRPLVPDSRESLICGSTAQCRPGSKTSHRPGGQAQGGGARGTDYLCPKQVAPQPTGKLLGYGGDGAHKTHGEKEFSRSRAMNSFCSLQREEGNPCGHTVGNVNAILSLKAGSRKAEAGDLEEVRKSKTSKV